MEELDEQPYNELSAAQVERLAMLSEECGEVVQIVGKILRHGYDSKHPTSGEINNFTLAKEIGDVLAVIKLMIAEKDIEEYTIKSCQKDKTERMFNYTHHQTEK